MMSAAVRYDGPAHHGSAPARGPGTGEQQPSGPAARPGAALPAHLLAAHAEALFASDLSIWCEYTRIEVTAAIRNAIGIHNRPSTDPSWGCELGSFSRDCAPCSADSGSINTEQLT